MCQIAMIVLGVMGLCNGISLHNLSVGILVAVGIQMMIRNIIKRCIEKVKR